jgi:hypothetical protein
VRMAVLCVKDVPDMRSVVACEWRSLPWNRNNPRKLEARPNDPTMTTSFAFDISIGPDYHGKKRMEYERPAPGALKNRSMASMKMEKHRARRNTPLMRAATISARCHPYEYRGEAPLFDN